MRAPNADTNPFETLKFNGVICLQWPTIASNAQKSNLTTGPKHCYII
jgi:hypothetical protein